MLRYILLGGCFFLIMITVVGQPSKSASDFYNNGVKLTKEEKYRDALKAFKAAIAKKPGYADALYQAGWCSNQLEQYKEALAYLEKAKKISSPAAKIYFELANAHENLGEMEEAILSYKKSIKLDSKYYSAYRNLGNIYNDLEDYQNAAENFAKYLNATENHDNQYYYKAGWCLNEIGIYGDALKYLNQYEPDSAVDEAKKYAELGYAYYRLQQNDEAIASYMKAIEIKPGHGGALRGLGDVYYNTRSYDKAIDYYEQAIQTDEENSKDKYYTLGWCYNDKGDYSKAASVLEKAILYKPNASADREELGYAYYMEENYELAMTELQEAVRLNSKSNLGYYYMGLCYVAMGRNDDARDAYEKLKPLNANQAEKLLKKINGE